MYRACLGQGSGVSRGVIDTALLYDRGASTSVAPGDRRMYFTLISAADLTAHLGEKNWAVVDCNFDLAQPAAGRCAYQQAHIPGAVYADLNRDLSAPIILTSGRHPLPDPTLFAERLGDWGIDNETQVIAYDADNGVFAARLWWLLRWLGHSRVAVLDGGFKQWSSAGLPVDGEIPQPPRKRFQAQVLTNVAADAQQVSRRIRRADWRVLDARAPERYAGEVEPIDPVAGHVPGARNYPFTRNLDPSSRFLPAGELRQHFEQVLGPVRSDHVIAMCGSGVTACHNLLAMEVAGLPGALLYPGSWSEWIRNPGRPVATGSQP